MLLKAFMVGLFSLWGQGGGGSLLWEGILHFNNV